MKDQRSNSKASGGLGQLKLIPPVNPPPPKIAGFTQTEVNHGVTPKVHSPFPNMRPEARDRLRRIGEPTATRLAQRSAPAVHPAAASANQQLADNRPAAPSLLALPPSFGMLIGTLLLAILLLNLTLGAFLWLGIIRMPWPRAATPPPSSAQALYSATPPPVLTAPARLEATVGEDVIFPIALDGTDGVPARSIIAISGLPKGSTFSSGRSYGETEWNLKPDEIGDLHLVLPNTASGRSKLTINLIAPDEAVLASTETILLLASAPEGSLQRAAEAGSGDAAADLVNQEPNLIGTAVLDVKPQLTEPQTWHERGQAPSPKKAKENPLQSPRNSPAKTTIANVDANWIVPSVFVNLREGPSPSAAVISVVAKGAKLRVIERKRHWVQVTNPETSEKGWIYTGHVVTVARARHKRPVHSGSPQASPPGSDSPWPSFGRG
jgi:hypothetical protein